MNNEEKILALLEQMNGRLDRLEQGQSELRSDVAALKKDVSTLKLGQEKLREDVEIIKEDVQVTRNATNTLLEWAEQAQVEVKIPLYKKAE